MSFAWWTGDWTKWKSWGICYGRHDWPSRCEWMIPGTWPGTWDCADTAKAQSTGTVE